MLKTIEKIKENDEFKSFQNSFREHICKLIEDLNGKIDESTTYFEAKYLNLDEVKKEIKNLINVKLTIELPDNFIEETISLTAEDEPKKKRARKKK